MEIFNFFSQDCNGNNVIIKIQAESEDVALDEFDFIYGKHTPVDQVIKGNIDVYEHNHR